MADLIKTYDLNKPIKSQTFKLTKDSVNKITFENDLEGQVVYKELNNKIAIEVYATTKIEHSYTKTVQYYDIKEDSDKCAVTSTKYIWAKVADEYVWNQVNTKNYVINKSNIPSNIKKGKQYQVEYIMTSKGNGSESTHSSTSALASPAKIAEQDALYKTVFIDKYGLVSKTLTENIEATLYIDKGNIATEMVLKVVNKAEIDLLTTTYVPQRKGNKYTGMYLNETVTSSEANETFDLKTGDDEVNFAFADGMGRVGNDVINLAKDEILTLRMMNSTSNDDLHNPDPDAEFLVNTSYTKSGNDLVMKYTNKYDDVLGQTTIKNYFKVAQDNITLKYSGASSEMVDYDYSLKEYLEWQDGIGILGNEDAETAQKITGNFLDNIIYGGSGNDTIKGVAGDNFIIAGKGDDKLYCGKDSDSFFIYREDAAGSKGDTIYNADNLDSIYLYDKDGNIDGGLNSNHFEFTKKGNTLTINYNDTPGNPESKTDKVTFVDYFKNNTELMNINDASTYSNVTINQTAKGTVKGTNYNDDIALTGKSNVYTGDGNDTIRFYYDTTDAQGTNWHTVDKNVTTYIDGTGNKTFSRTKDDEKGKGQEVGDMGNKTIVFNTIGVDTHIVNLNLGVDTESEKEGYIYSKKGNDLNIEGYFNLQGEGYNPQNANYDSYGSYTIKNYFSDKFGYKGEIQVDGDEFGLKDPDTYLYQQGKKNKAATFYDTEYNDYILGANKNDKYYFTNGGNDKAVDVKGNDTYNVASLSNSLIIDDKAGTKDKLVVSDTNAYSLYFKVTREGTSVSGVGSNLQIFDKSKIEDGEIVGGVTIENYIDTYQAGGTVQTGAGCIESIKVGGNALDINLNSIAQNVVNWLVKEGYESSEAVFDDPEGDINTMLAIYAGQN